MFFSNSVIKTPGSCLKIRNNFEENCFKKLYWKWHFLKTVKQRNQILPLKNKEKDKIRIFLFGHEEIKSSQKHMKCYHLNLLFYFSLMFKINNKDKGLYSMKGFLIK